MQEDRRGNQHEQQGERHRTRHDQDDETYEKQGRMMLHGRNAAKSKRARRRRGGELRCTDPCNISEPTLWLDICIYFFVYWLTIELCVDNI